MTEKMLVILPSEDYDVSEFLSWSLLDQCEIRKTWSKNNDKQIAYDTIMEETKQFKLSVQIGCNISKKIAWWKNENEYSNGLEKSIKETRGDTYVNLHHHDEYSIRDGLGTVDGLAKLQIARGNPFVAVTNHGSIGGWIKQHDVCKKSGLKAIYGAEFYVNDYRDDDPEERKLHRANNHLVVLARNKEGYDNITRMHNDAQLNGFYYLPRCNYEAFEKYGKGVIALSACYAGEISSLLMDDNKEGALEAYKRYTEAFDEFYIELTMANMDDQIEANNRLIQFAKEVNAPMVITSDSHYIFPEHAETHNVLLCIKTNNTLKDAKEGKDEVWQFSVDDLYYRNEKETRELWESKFKNDIFTEDVLNEAIKNTRRIAIKCEEIVLDSEYKLPKLYENGNDVLKKKAWEGFKKRNLENKPGYAKRLQRELDTIIKLGFADYFLVVEKIVSGAFTKYGEWALSYGRGSCAGSLVSYCLYITFIDPIKYNILFERFLDEGRKNDVPDIDLDFHPDIRDKVKEDIVNEFGERHTCSIATYMKYKTSSVIIDCARALGHDVWEAMKVTTQMMPGDAFNVGDGDDIHEEKIDNMSFEELFRHYEPLRQYMEEHPDVLQHAIVLRNQIKNMGKHAGGMIISNIDLHDSIPIFRDKHGQIVSSWAEGQATHELSSIGVIKYDFLSISNLAIIQDTLRYIKENKGIEITREDIKIDDGEAIKNNSKKDLVGIFQFESPATKPVSDAVKMESIEDISAVTSLIRPGPRDEGMDEIYAKRKHGKESYSVPKCIENLLKGSYGIAIYQDDVMQIAQIMCGFTPIESNVFRRVLVKEKDPVVLEKMRQKFITGAKPRIEKGELTEEEVDRWWILCKSFIGYGFNKTIDENTLVYIIDKGNMKIKDVNMGDLVLSYNEKKKTFEKSEVVALHDHGIIEGFEIELEDGSKEICSINHKFLTKEGQLPLYDILRKNLEILSFSR